MQQKNKSAVACLSSSLPLSAVLKNATSYLEFVREQRLDTIQCPESVNKLLLHTQINPTIRTAIAQWLQITHLCVSSSLRIKPIKDEKQSREPGVMLKGWGGGVGGRSILPQTDTNSGDSLCVALTWLTTAKH